MKISKNELKKMISEELNGSSILLEMPTGPIVGQEQMGPYTKDPDGYEGDMAKRSLYHMAAQAQQRHDVIQDDENLKPWVQAKITKAAAYLEAAFKAITYDKQNPEGR